MRSPTRAQILKAVRSACRGCRMDFRLAQPAKIYWKCDSYGPAVMIAFEKWNDHKRGEVSPTTFKRFTDYFSRDMGTPETWKLHDYDPRQLKFGWQEVEADHAR